MISDGEKPLRHTYLGLDLGCGAFQANENIYEKLNRDYLGKTLWLGIDSSMSMLSYCNRSSSNSKNNLIVKDSFALDLRHLNKLNASLCFDYCLSVSMLQWLTHSRLDTTTVRNNLISLLSFLTKCMDSHSHLVFQFYPDCYKNILNLFSILQSFNFQNVLLYMANPHGDSSRKLFFYFQIKK